MTDLQGLMIELELLKQKISKQMTLQQITKEKTKVIILSTKLDKNYALYQEYSSYRQTLDQSKKYFLITLTFSPKKIFNTDTLGQEYILLQINKIFFEYTYYMCIEQHKNKNLHSHILIQCGDIHNIYEKLQTILYKLTDCRRMTPAIDYKPVTQTIKDIQNTYDYIWFDKKDHPKYKYLEINY